MKKFLVLLCFIVMIFGMVSTSQANALPLEWSFTPPSITVSPTDNIDLIAEITNVSSADFSANYDNAQFHSGSFYGVYAWFWGTFISDWTPLSLPAGASETFTFGTFKPISGSAPVGTYSLGTFVLPHISFDGVGDIYSMNLFEATVVSAVPEPATLLLLGSGLVGLVGLRRKFKA